MYAASARGERTKEPVVRSPFLLKKNEACIFSRFKFFGEIISKSDRVSQRKCSLSHFLNVRVGFWDVRMDGVERYLVLYGQPLGECTHYVVISVHIHTAGRRAGMGRRVVKLGMNEGISERGRD
jgi:hypothetical protein